MFISGVHNPAKQYCDLYVGPVGIASVIFPESDINLKDSIHGALFVSKHGTYGINCQNTSDACTFSIRMIFGVLTGRSELLGTALSSIRPVELTESNP